MSEMHYVDQSADALRLSVLQGPPDRSSLTILCEDERPLAGGGAIHGGIIGQSHFFSLAPAGGPTLTEVFACIEQSADNRVAFLGPLDHVQGGLSLKSGPLSYHFAPPVRGKIEKLNSEITRLEKEVASIQEDATNHKNQIGLGFSFPGDYAYKAETLLVLSWVTAQTEVTAQQVVSLVVESCHVYPNHGDVVFTRTFITPS